MEKVDKTFQAAALILLTVDANVSNLRLVFALTLTDFSFRQSLWL